MRTELNLGYHCNNNCRFCGEGRNREEYARDPSVRITTDDAMRTIMEFHRAGSRHLTFLGGEPTIRKDFLEILTFAKGLGFTSLLMTTNGRMLAKKAFARQVIDAGLNDIVLSIHGHDAATHDGITRSPGSFDQMMHAAANLRELGTVFSTCTVINKRNESALAEIVGMLLEFEPRRMLLTFPAIHGNALSDFHDIVSRFTDAAPHVIAAIETARTRGAWITVGHVPFCMVPGYEGYVDILYWGDRAKRVVQKYIGKDVEPDGHVVDRHGSNKVRVPICEGCRYGLLCEGVDKMYVRMAGTAEFKRRPRGFEGLEETDAEALKSRTHFYKDIVAPADEADHG